MLKRVNIHLDDTNLNSLKALASKIRNSEFWFIGKNTVKRAHLIRYAIAKTFGFEYLELYPEARVLAKAIKKALKKAT